MRVKRFGIYSLSLLELKMKTWNVQSQHHRQWLLWLSVHWSLWRCKGLKDPSLSVIDSNLNMHFTLVGMFKVNCTKVSIENSCQGQFIFTANWTEARTIKYTNFPAKYTNSRSKLHWNIRVVLHQVSVTWNNRWGIGIPKLHDHAERHSAFNTSSKWILLVFDFYDIFF